MSNAPDPESVLSEIEIDAIMAEKQDPARGCINGIILSLPIWAAIVAAIAWAVA